MADSPSPPPAAAPAAAPRSRIGAFGSFLLSAFTSMSGGATFPPSPEEIEEGKRQTALAEEEARRQRVLRSAMSYDDQLLRDQYDEEGGRGSRLGQRAIRKLRSSASLRSLRSAGSVSSLRKRFRRGGKGDGGGIGGIAEIEEEGEDGEERTAPAVGRMTPAPAVGLVEDGGRGVLSMDSSEASTVSRSNTDSTRN